MTEEERRIITGYVERVAGAAQQPVATSSGPWGGRSVPSTQPAPNLPPVDPEADRLISDLFSRYPEARYRITQTAFVQEAALVQAQNRIQELEWQLENTQRQAQANAQPQGGGGLFGGLFGGGNRQQQQVPFTPRPQPIQPPPGAMNPAMMQQQGGRGSGFLGTALTTAAGVAGGMVLGNALMGMFSGGAAHAATGAATAASDAASGATGAFGEQAVNTPTSSPWTDPAGTGNDATPVSDQGGWGGNDAAGYNDARGYDDAAGYDDAGGYDEDI
ncbi:DUF2076 domain-containing protein [Roseomonas populi]|uniref:DUF2076 domain-containing protein n=1 Tax=Roseomonas populi TaxID=3121582 RepID=A0ABT1X602_9PROT|nr:DUF2076 domain-containing protein [Roseomonas pecuniae]MCR0983535.1 DUF2076 domain-containing protein [Roseomonas pecuniae]